MLKLLAKVAEKFAKNTNTACFVLSALHQPKMPTSLVEKD
jgi:cyclic lactone autoinducer peptide